jgi:hypothetical protein
MNVPVFAVVGHPNKGKSSIVATLACDDSVMIGPEPGTTIDCREYPMRVDGEVLYVLTDTPGFQRARKALAWMRERETNAAEHPDIVGQFVSEHRPLDDFPDECRLLQPLLDGAGVLYVVDGSVPYGPEYEAEMKILRWTGRPSMGLINPIGSAEFVEPWRAALGQYFSVVRVFDAVHSDFQKRLDLLSAFGELQESWRAPLARAVESLKNDRSRKAEQSARYVADSLVDMLTLRIEEPHDRFESESRAKENILKNFKERLSRMERKARDRVEEVYEQKSAHRIETELPLLDHDLFSSETWKIFGLSRIQLTGLGAVGGGAIGGMVDIAAGGTSFLLGTVIGSATGVAASFAAQRSLSKVKILNQPIAGRRIVAEPVEHPNFPHVVFGRARLHHAVVSRRTHAQRDDMSIDEAAHSEISPLAADRLRRLDACFSKIRKKRKIGAATEDMIELIRDQFTDDTAAGGS